jgi:hypothetical protein
MQAKFINTEESSNKSFAAYDRRMRNIANASHYTEAERVRAERMRMALTLVYAGVVYTPSYGTTGVSIKVVGFVADAKNLKALEADWAEQGVIKKESAQGIIYRFKA